MADRPEKRDAVTTRPNREPRPPSRAQEAAIDLAWAAREADPSDEMVSFLRDYFLSHTLDPLTGEIYTLH